MKKLISSAFIALAAVTAYAGGVENKTNMSTGYLRNPSRNTENERPEAAFYNIAGTGFMADGLYIEAGNQFVFKETRTSLKPAINLQIRKNTAFQIIIPTMRQQSSFTRTLTLSTRKTDGQCSLHSVSTPAAARLHIQKEQARQALCS